MFHKPVLMINDAESIRIILVKEFNKFADRGIYHNAKIDPLTDHLFLQGGERWRYLRTKLSPTFTSGKLKLIYPLMKEIGDELIKVTNEMTEIDNEIDVKSLASR